MHRHLLILLILLVATAPAAAQDGDAERQRAQRLLVRGLTHLQTDDEEAALESFEMALQFAPNEPSVLISIASAYSRLGDFAAAVFYGERAVQQDPTNAQILLELAAIQQASGARGAAGESFLRAAERFREQPEVVLDALRYFLEQGDFDVASGIAIDMIGRHGIQPDLLDLLSHWPSEAAAPVEAAIIRHLDARPGDIGVVLAWMLSSGDGGRYPALVAAIERAMPGELVITVDDEVARDHREADALSGEQLERLIDDRPSDVSNWVRTAEAYLSEGRPSDAWRIASESVIIFPGQADLALLAASAAIERQNFDDAQRILAATDHPAATILIGFIDAVKGDERATEQLATDPGDSALPHLLTAYQALGMALVGDGAAAARYGDLLPDDAGAHPLFLEAQGWVRFLQGDRPGAERALAAAAEIGEPRPRVLALLARILEESGRASDAEMIRARLPDAQ